MTPFARHALTLLAITAVVRGWSTLRQRDPALLPPGGARSSGPVPRPALASPEADKGVRDSGPDAMRDPPRRWDTTDEAVDESFPASDPPSTY